MKDHEKELNEHVRMYRLTAKQEAPMILGRRMNPNEYDELLQFCVSLADAMNASQEKQEKPLTKEQLFGMCLSTAKWSIEEYTTRKPALRKEI